MKMILPIILILLFIGFAVSCKKTDAGQRISTTPWKLEIPDGWPSPHYSFTNNALTLEGFELGKKLFYDGRLSKDGNFACASCHQQFAAFSTFDHDFSHGFNNQFTKRNAPGLFNLAWHKDFHWDGGINHIEVQPLAPITAQNEMAETMESVVNKVKADATYRSMFGKAFGDEEVTSQRMMKALASFMNAMVSYNSKYDKVKRGEASFTGPENTGYTIFKTNCAGCHTEPLFTDLSFRNNGLSENPTIRDKGRMHITNNATDSLKFKVPSLRNILLTFPYMHDGRFKSPLMVLDHYSSGIQQSATLDPILKNGISLSEMEKLYLLEFFKTLTDSTFINDKRFAAPQ